MHNKPIKVSTGNFRRSFGLFVKGSTFHRRADLHRLGFEWKKPAEAWFGPWDVKVLEVLEEWPEVQVSEETARMARDVRQAMAKREARRRASAIKTLVDVGLVLLLVPEASLSRSGRR